jgi:hypothetical protein
MVYSGTDFFGCYGNQSKTVIDGGDSFCLYHFFRPEMAQTNAQDM